MKCKICGVESDLLNKNTGKPKVRPICGTRKCNNKWTWEAKKEEYRKKKLAAYYIYKKEKVGYVEEINRKAKAKQRYGVQNRKAFINTVGMCENCGEKKKLLIHHIDNKGRRAEKDGEKVNNNPSNLMVLCPSCHVKHHIKGMKLERRYSPILQETVS